MQGSTRSQEEAGSARAAVMTSGGAAGRGSRVLQLSLGYTGWPPPRRLRVTRARRGAGPGSAGRRSSGSCRAPRLGPGGLSFLPILVVPPAAGGQRAGGRPGGAGQDREERSPSREMRAPLEPAAGGGAGRGRGRL